MSSWNLEQILGFLAYNSGILMSQLALQRLDNQFISAPHPGSLAEMLAQLGAVQGQDYLGTLWALGLRSGLTQAQAEESYAQPAPQATIVRSWLMRGTLHFVAAADLGWMVELVAPRLLSGLRRRYGELELDAGTLEKSDRLLLEAIRAEGPLRRDALRSRLEAAGISTTGQRAVHMLQHASLQGLIYQAAVQRNQAVFELVERLPPGIQFSSREAALGELARRYFSTHGPATVQDFIWWSGLTAAEARQALGAAQESQANLESQVVCGITYWGCSKPGAKRVSSATGDTHSTASPLPVEDCADERMVLDASTPQADPQGAYLLPGFDEYLLSYKDRSASISPEHQQRWMSNTNGMPLSTVVIGGKVVGTWKRTLGKKAVRVEVQPFEAFSPAQEEAIQAAAQEYANFLKMPLIMA